MSDKQVLKNRHEFLFGHDVKWANPNGDPLDENRPRLDDETSILLVRDARIKRTIRDTIEEFYEGNGREIFIRKDYKPDGKPKTKTDIVAEAKQEIDKDKDSGSFLSKLLEKFIDIRLFGATFALPKDKDSKGSGKGKQQNKDQESSQEEKQEESDLNNNESLVGPVQFQFGRSIHRVTIEKIQGTSIMPSEGGKAQGTFTEQYVVPYAFVLFYGIANEKAAEDTHLTDEDLSLMFEAMWLGYKAGTDVLSGSKLGHAPRILIDIVYKPGIMAHIGDLDSCIKHNPRPGLEDEAIRSIEDFSIDITRLIDELKMAHRPSENVEKIEKIRVAVDHKLKITYNGQEFSGKDLIAVIQRETGIPTEEFDWFKRI